FLLVAGCRHLVTGAELQPRHAWLLLPTVVVAVALPALAGVYFNALLVVQKAIMAGFYAAAFVVTLTGRHGRARGGGLNTLLVLLALLTLNFAQYALLSAYSLAVGRPQDFSLLQCSSLIDMTLQVLLAYSMTMVVTDSLRRELESASQELAAAGRRF